MQLKYVPTQSYQTLIRTKLPQLTLQYNLRAFHVVSIPFFF